MFLGLSLSLGAPRSGGGVDVPLPEFAGLSFAAAAPATEDTAIGSLVGTIVPTGATAARPASLAFILATAPTEDTPVGTLIGTLP